LVPCPFPLNLSRSFGEFVPYTLRHNLDVQIPLFKKSLAFTFFSERPVAYGILSPCSLWNSLPLEIKSSPSHPNFMNRLKSYYHVAKQNTHHILGVNPRSISVRCMFRLAHSPLNINKKSYRTCVCGDIETEIHLFFYCNFHDDARAILSNRVCNIVIDNKSPEFFVCLSNVELLRIFLFGLPDEESSRISVAVFRPVDDFLKSCNRFDIIRATLYTIYGRFVLSCCIFFVDADRLQLSLYLCDVPDASTSFQCCIQYC